MDQGAYQLVLLGGRRHEWGGMLVDAVLGRLRDIGPGLDRALVVLGPGDLSSVRATAPVVAAYLGGDDNTDVSDLETLLAAAMPVIPVVDDLRDFRNKVPAVLRPINGIAVGMVPDFTEVANLVLENLSLLRRSRKLFISYLRAEATVAAHQLRVAFDDGGYDAFLDTSSVPKGDDFQAVLWHRLLDSDVMVVLDTENFLGSRWTVRELAEASAMSVGMLRVVWPGVLPVRGAELAEHLHLEDWDFDGDRLTDAAVERIGRAVGTPARPLHSRAPHKSRRRILPGSREGRRGGRSAAGSIRTRSDEGRAADRSDTRRRRSRRPALSRGKRAFPAVRRGSR